MSKTRSVTKSFWTHPSVVQLSGMHDPVKTMIESARALALDAMQRGWSGPPFDPFALAEILGIRLIPADDVLDARISVGSQGGFYIEFNPNRPAVRIRYSIAHELAHTLFPDCEESVRDRVPRAKMRDDDWQLEMLCNLGASEILMPIGSFLDLRKVPLGIDSVSNLRGRFEVSYEAMLLRLIKLTDLACFAFCCARGEPTDGPGRYVIDYTVPSKGSVAPCSSGYVLPIGSRVEECTAIGYTAKFDEDWPHVGRVHLETVGIPPYPGHEYPRVAGIATFPSAEPHARVGITYLVGDATEPRGDGQRILAFVVNDRARSWGAGFGLAVQRKWPFVQREFELWKETEPLECKLGNVHETRISTDLLAMMMVCQRGYGPSRGPRIRYDALQQCLRKLGDEALASKATVHMPRIGSGQAGGSWDVISEMIEETLCSEGLDVVVYDLPASERSAGYQRSLFGEPAS